VDRFKFTQAASRKAKEAMDEQRIGRRWGAVLWAIILLSGACTSRQAQARSMEARDPGNYTSQVLAASVQISMTLRMNPANGADPSEGETQLGGERNIALGLGSLVEKDGHAWIVTHNHWKDLLHDLCLVEFRDAENRLLLRLFGFEFKDLIIQSDAGTLILRAPEGLVEQMTESGALAVGVIGDSGDVRPGDVVQVAHRQPGRRDRVEVMEAVVESVVVYKGLPAFQLRSLDGQPVLIGDSGGGMWHEGRLVGNLWATLTVPQPADGSAAGTQNPVATEVSYAAVYPGE
jgi:hypothetical protein